MASLKAGKGPLGVSRALALLLGAVAVAAAACGGGPTPTATSTVQPTASATATAAVSPTNPAGSGASSSPSASGSAGPCSLGAHADEALEAMLPNQVGPYMLCKGSYPLSMFMNSAKTNDKTLYAEWLTRLGAKAEETSLALAIDTTDNEVITVLGFRPKTADPTNLLAAFKASLDKLHWPNQAILLAQKAVIQATDVGGGQTGEDVTAYAYQKGAALFLVITQDPSLALQAFIALP